MATLDRSRSYGTVYGAGPAHAFEQDGIVFDFAGNEVGAAPAKAAGKGKAAAAEPAKDGDQLNDQLHG